MTVTQGSIPAIDLPFSTLAELQTALRPLLSSEGIFIETQYPPAVGLEMQMILRVGAQREEVGRFLAKTIAHQAVNPGLAGKKGVQLEFIKLDPAAQRLLGELNIIDQKYFSEKTEGNGSEGNEILSLDDAQMLANESHIDQEATTAVMPDSELPTPEATMNLTDAESEAVMAETRSLAHPKTEADPLENYLRKPVDIRHTGNDEGMLATDDFSNFQGQGGYEMSDLILGIDLGTCNSCVAVVKDGEIKVLADDKGFTTTPSVVAYTEQGSVIVGREAQSLMTKSPRTCIFGAKRFIGRNYNSPIVQNMISFFPYKVVPDDKNHTAIDVYGKSVSLETVSSEILKHMVSVAQHAIGEEVNKVIITVPAYYSDNQRAAVKEAGTLAGLNVIRIVNEPTAAALSVGFNQRMNKRLLVYDLGGGTFDVSILETKDDTFQVAATGGDTFLGGEDFDLRLVKWVMDSSREENIHLARNPVTFERLKQACEKAKRELSDKRETAINLPYIQLADGKTINFQKKIDREHLVHLTRDFVERSLKICDAVLVDAKLTINDIDEVVLVGGMTRMPFVRNSVHQHYNKKPFGDVNPDEAVAMGAAILGGQMVGTRKISLVDVLSMNIGIALPKNRFKPILMKNMQVPCSKKYKISANLDSEFNIDIFQGESQKCDENEYLGTLVFSDEVKGSSMQTLEIEFALNAECLLNCTIRNPASGKMEKALLMTHDTPPSAKLA